MARVYLEEFIKKLKKSNLFFFVMMIAFSGCTSLTVTNAIPEVESPVYIGRKSFGFSFLANIGKELNLIDDPSARPPDLTYKQIDVPSKFISRPAIHYYPYSRISLTGGIENSSLVFFKTKIGILNGLVEDPPKGVFYAAANLESTYEIAKKSGNQKGFGGAAGYPWTAMTQNLTATAGISIGYQWQRRLVPFIGFNYQYIQTTGQINQSAGASDPGGNYGMAQQIGFTRVYAIGLDWRPKYGFYFTPEITYYEFSWGGNSIKEGSGNIKLTYIPVQ